MAARARGLDWTVGPHHPGVEAGRYRRARQQRQRPHVHQPVELRAFEQDAGATNRQTVRMETNAGYTVERIPAARRIT
jgi:hypothetical protein